jgi:hypothetical protein
MLDLLKLNKMGEEIFVELTEGSLEGYFENKTELTTVTENQECSVAFGIFLEELRNKHIQ